MTVPTGKLLSLFRIPIRAHTKGCLGFVQNCVLGQLCGVRVLGAGCNCCEGYARRLLTLQGSPTNSHILPLSWPCFAEEGGGGGGGGT